MIRNLLSAFVLFLSFLSHSQTDSIAEASKLFGIPFTQAERDSMRDNLTEQLAAFREIRTQSILNEVPYSMMFAFPVNEDRIPKTQAEIKWNLPAKLKLPDRKDDLAFYSVAELSVLIKTKQITSLELTQFFLDRLKKYGDTLQCVITLTESLALEQARRADKELAAGIYRGPLHGIPYGAKDLLAVAGYPTTWGATPFKDQQLDYTATAIKRLEEAGAVLVAKLTLGALAWGDVWFGGVTKNPWNLSEGSSGSSAGSASAASAGLVPFAIGSETWGSIVSPSTRCGTTGLRPTYGRVSKAGAMALSWSMDKLGPICRSAEDCALVFQAINGKDPLDLQTVDRPFNYTYPLDFKKLRIGYLKEELSRADGYNHANDSITLALLRKQGFTLVEKQLPDKFDVSSLTIILTAEASAAFDELTRTNQDDQLVRQIKNAWPNTFRSGRFIPAVEYIQANRLRYQLVADFNVMMSDIDVLVSPSFEGDQLLMTNLTGHPCVVLPNGSYALKNPGTITLVGNHFDEATLLAVGKYLQSLTPFEDEHPAAFK